MNIAEKTPAIIRFGAFEADVRAGELRRSGLRIKLQEQPFRVLAILLEHPGEVVTREEFRARLWPTGTFVDFDNSLNTDINKVREALGDSALHPRFVETLPRRGYRFVAPLGPGLQLASSPGFRTQEVDPAATAEPKASIVVEETEPELPLRLRRWQNSDVALAAAACMAAVLFVALFNRVTPYHHVRFLSEKEAVASAGRALERLGLRGQIHALRPLATIMEYPRLAMNTDSDWLDTEMTRSASAWIVAVELSGARHVWGEPLVGGQNWIVSQDGNISQLFVDVRPPVFAAGLTPDELRRRLSEFAREFSGRVEPGMEYQPGQTGVLFIRKASSNLPQVSINAGIWNNQNFSMITHRWNVAGSGGSDWREWTHGPRIILTAVCVLAVALFFLRKLYRQPARLRFALITAVIVVLLFTSIRRIVEDAAISVLPRWIVYVWRGWTRDLFPEWRPIVSALLTTAFVLVLVVVVYCMLALIAHYARLGDPVRTRTFRTHFDGWKQVVGVTWLRGTMLGICLAASFALLLIATAWTRKVFPGNEWLSTVLYAGFYLKPVPLSGSTVAWRLFSVAALESALVALLVAFPASLAARAGASRKIVIGAAIGFWMLLQVSLVGLTTYDPLFAMIGIALQSVAVVLIYSRYDLLTAMATVFTAEVITMSCGAYQVFRSLGASYYTLPVALWVLLIASALLAVYLPQTRAGMLRLSKVFE